MRIWLDAGTGTPEAAAEIAEWFEHCGVGGRVVVGLESLVDGATLGAIVESVGAERMVFSLDLKQGTPLTASPDWRGRAPSEIANIAVLQGVCSLIVLDLAGVGVGRGVPSLELCRQLRAAYPKLEIVTGGGVRGIGDLDAISDAGCNGVLVASALHDGRITPEGLAGWAEQRGG
jgi:phosphoribosylformimino-5-aminoimidazole carboxamide ribotide isomerase